MLKLKITVGADSLEIDGDVALADVRPFIDTWFTVLQALALNPDALREMTARLTASTHALSQAERADAAHPEKERPA